jgi:hypothetical protein
MENSPGHTPHAGRRPLDRAESLIMNTFEILLYEIASIPERINGLKGVGMLVILAALTVVIPVRFGTSMLSPLLLLVLSAVAPLLAGNFLARSFATEKANARIINSDDPALAVATGKVLAATAWGVLMWTVFLAVPLAALNMNRTHVLLPPVSTLLSLALLAGSLSWFATSAGSIFAVGAPSPATAQTFVRGIILLPVLLFTGIASLMPAGFLATLLRAVRTENLPFTLAAVSALLILAGFPALRKTAEKIEELRHPLSILGDQP